MPPQIYGQAKPNASEFTIQYKRIVGIFLYIATHRRLDIALCTSMLARFGEKPSMKHQTGAIKVVKYLNSTIDRRPVMKRQSSTKLIAHADANWTGVP